MKVSSLMLQWCPVVLMRRQRFLFYSLRWRLIKNWFCAVPLFLPPDVIRRSLSESRKLVARWCLYSLADNRLSFFWLGRNGNVYFSPVEKVVRSRFIKTAVEIRHCHIPDERGAGGIYPRRGGAEQASQERAGKAAGQTRELPGDSAQVKDPPFCNTSELLITILLIQTNLLTRSDSVA